MTHILYLKYNYLLLQFKNKFKFHKIGTRNLDLEQKYYLQSKLENVRFFFFFLKEKPLNICIACVERPFNY